MIKDPAGEAEPTSTALTDDQREAFGVLADSASPKSAQDEAIKTLAAAFFYNGDAHGESLYSAGARLTILSDEPITSRDSQPLQPRQPSWVNGNPFQGVSTAEEVTTASEGGQELQSRSFVNGNAFVEEHTTAESD